MNAWQVIGAVLMGAALLLFLWSHLATPEYTHTEDGDLVVYRGDDYAYYANGSRSLDRHVRMHSPPTPEEMKAIDRNAVGCCLGVVLLTLGVVCLGIGAL